MKTSFLILLALLLPRITSAQESENEYLLKQFNEAPFEPDGIVKGSGIVEIDLGKEYYGNDIIIYDANGVPKITIRVTANEVTTQCRNRKYLRSDTTNPFKPRNFTANPDYFVLALDCRRITDKYYEVVIDQKTNAVGFIKKNDRLFKYQTIDAYVREWSSLGLEFDRVNNPLRKMPDDNAPSIANGMQQRFRIWTTAHHFEMKGDWMRITTVENEEGWIRWRRGNKIIVRLHFAC